MASAHTHAWVQQLRAAGSSLVGRAVGAVGLTVSLVDVLPRRGTAQDIIHSLSLESDALCDLRTNVGKVWGRAW